MLPPFAQNECTVSSLFFINAPLLAHTNKSKSNEALTDLKMNIYFDRTYTINNFNKTNGKKAEWTLLHIYCIMGNTRLLTQNVLKGSL